MLLSAPLLEFRHHHQFSLHHLQLLLQHKNCVSLKNMLALVRKYREPSAAVSAAVSHCNYCSGASWKLRNLRISGNWQGWTRQRECLLRGILVCMDELKTDSMHYLHNDLITTIPRGPALRSALQLGKDAGDESHKDMSSCGSCRHPKLSPSLLSSS